MQQFWCFFSLKSVLKVFLILIKKMYDYSCWRFSGLLHLDQPI